MAWTELVVRPIDSGHAGKPDIRQIESEMIGVAPSCFHSSAPAEDGTFGVRVFDTDCAEDIGDILERHRFMVVRRYDHEHHD